MVYNSALPTREDRKRIRDERGTPKINPTTGEPVLDTNCDPIKVYSKRDFLRDMYNPECFGYDNTTSADLIPQVGNVRVNTEQLDHDYPWYRQALQNNTPKNFTAYQIFKKYLFQPAFNDGRAIVEERLGRNLTGPEKLRFIASISADVWNTEVSRLLNPQGALTQKKTSKRLNAVPKVRHESWILLEV